MPRRFVGAKIKFLSLVKRGANRMPVIYKEDGTFDLDTIVKFSDDFMEKGELTAIVYAPEVRDSQGDIASAQVIKQMMYDAAKDGLNIDIRHDGKPLSKDDAFIAEQFIVQKGDPRFEGMKDYAGNPVDPTGSWGTVIKIENLDLRKKYKEEGWNGVSMGGLGEMIQEKEDDSLFKKFMRLFVKDKPETGEIEMKAEELKKMLDESNKTLLEGLAKVLKPETKKEGAEGEPEKEGDKNPAPTFKGDISNPEDIRKHEVALAKWSIFKDVDMTDVVAIKAAREKLEAFLKESEEAEGEPKKDTEVERLEKELAEAKKRSNQPIGEAKKKQDKGSHFEGEGVSKEDEELASVGSSMAEWINGRK